jgi:hypothetical protein
VWPGEDEYLRRKHAEHRTLDYLKLKNPLPEFDGRVYQEPTEHVYFVIDDLASQDEGRTVYRPFPGSCTGAIHEHEPEFDREAVWEKMRAKGRFDDPNDIYYQMEKGAVFVLWEETRDQASDYGSEMHAAIELHANGAADPNDPIWSSEENKPSLDRYLAFYVDYIINEECGEVFGEARTPEYVVHATTGVRQYELKARYFRTEVALFSDGVFAGMFDVLLQKPNGMFTLGDWKRSKKQFVNPPHFNRYFKRFLSHLPYTQLNVYRLQLSLYALCIMRFCPYIRIDELRLGVFHPINPTYLWLRLAPLYAEAIEIVRWRYMNFLDLYSSKLTDGWIFLSRILYILAAIWSPFKECKDALPDYDSEMPMQQCARTMFPIVKNVLRLLRHIEGDERMLGAVSDIRETLLDVNRLLTQGQSGGLDKLTVDTISFTPPSSRSL